MYTFLLFIMSLPTRSYRYHMELFLHNDGTTSDCQYLMSPNSFLPFCSPCDAALLLVSW